MLYGSLFLNGSALRFSCCRSNLRSAAEIIGIVGPVHLFLQFWYHTEHIPKLGWLEYIIVTPSQHRVHHAMNPEYIDKNLAPIFFSGQVIWHIQEESMTCPQFTAY